MSELTAGEFQAAGFPDPGPGDRVIGGQLADLAAGMAAAEAMFGEDAVLQLVRVMGSAMARLAEAIVSAFLVNVESAVAPKAVAMAAGIQAEPVGHRQLKGFDDDVELCRLLAP